MHIMKDVVNNGSASQSMSIRQNETISKETQKTDSLTDSLNDSLADNDNLTSPAMMNPISFGGSIELIKHRHKQRSPSIRQTSLRHRFATKQAFSKNVNTELDADNKPFSYIASLIQDLQWALTDLGWECTDLGLMRSVTSLDNQKISDERKIQIEKWAYFVDTSLTGIGRNVHGIFHIIEVSELASSLQFLAAAFRDVISYSVCCSGDDEFIQEDLVEDIVLSKQQEEIISDVLYREWKVDENFDNRKNESKLCTVINLSTTLISRTDLVVCSIFDHEPRDNMKPFAGLNRGLDIFLSTITAARQLKNVLRLSQIAQLATIMEATIPIRNINDKNTTKQPLEDLYTRLVQCNRKFKLSMSVETMIETVQLGADLRNRLFGYMASTDLAIFLDKIWAMLPERNPSMRDLAIYTITDYYKALQSATGIISQIEPQSFFFGFRGLPSPNEITSWQDQCSNNLQHLQLYMEARLISVAIVMCLARLTGGINAPNTFFFGDIPSARNTKPERLGNRIDLPDELPYSDDGIVDQTVYELLRGRDEMILINEFDTQSAPLAAYIYKELGADQIKDVLQYFILPCNAQSAREFLKMLPFHVFETIAREFGELTRSRAGATNQLIQELEDEIGKITSMYFL